MIISLPKKHTRHTGIKGYVQLQTIIFNFEALHSVILFTGEIAFWYHFTNPCNLLPNNKAKINITDDSSSF